MCLYILRLAFFKWNITIEAKQLQFDYSKDGVGRLLVIQLTPGTNDIKDKKLIYNNFFYIICVFNIGIQQGHDKTVRLTYQRAEEKWGIYCEVTWTTRRFKSSVFWVIRWLFGNHLKMQGSRNDRGVLHVQYTIRFTVPHFCTAVFSVSIIAIS